MPDNNKKLNKKPKLSSYWIYGLILVVFLFINIFSGGLGSSGAQSTPSQFFEYLEPRNQGNFTSESEFSDLEHVDVIVG